MCRVTAAQRDGCSFAWSRTIRTARARTSGENLFVVLLVRLHPLRSWSLRQTRGGSALTEARHFVDGHAIEIWRDTRQTIKVTIRKTVGPGAAQMNRFAPLCLSLHERPALVVDCHFFPDLSRSVG
jgi:hypothetical protein